MSLSLSTSGDLVGAAESVGAEVAVSVALGDQLARLYDVVQRSDHVFGSPAGPIATERGVYHLPRFVYFGPQASDASLRLAFLAGFEQRDLRATLALLHQVEGLARDPYLGQGLDLSFYPLIDVLGLAKEAAGRNLRGESWRAPTSPELRLLAAEARSRGYHGFLRLESTDAETVVVVVRTPPASANPTPQVELITAEDVAPFPVRWVQETVDAQGTGPLSLVADLPQRPFELVIQLPRRWTNEVYRAAALSILQRFVIRYRGFIAYGQHL